MSTKKCATDKGFILFTDQLTILKNIPNEQLGEAIKLLLENFETMEEINASPFTNMAYELIATNVRRYRQETLKARENGLKGGNPILNPTLKGTLNPTLKLQDNTIQDNTIQDNKKQNNYILDDYNKTTIKNFLNEYQKIFLNVPYIDEKAKNKILELNANIPDFINVSKRVFKKFKNIGWTYKNGKPPDITWLLKDSNYISLANSRDDISNDNLDELIESVIGKNE